MKFISKKVLVIEDDPDTIFFVVKSLRIAGYAPIEARDGKTGIKKFKETKPDVVILDVMLPEINGWDVLKKIKSGFKSKNVPVIVVTARDEDVDKLKGYKLGADYYVTKPFNIKHLLSTIETVLTER